MIDVLLLAILGVVTWCVASDGAWSAVVTFLCTLIAGLIAMNFFEPVAALLEGISPFFCQSFRYDCPVGPVYRCPFRIATGL